MLLSIVDVMALNLAKGLYTWNFAHTCVNDRHYNPRLKFSYDSLATAEECCSSVTFRFAKELDKPENMSAMRTFQASGLKGKPIL